MKTYYSKAILACLLWSTAFVGVKTGLTYSTPLFFAGVRFMLAGVLVLLFTNSYRRILAYVRATWRLILLIGLLQTTIMYGLYYHGVNLLPAGIAAIIIGAGPIITALTAHLMLKDDRLSLRKSTSMLISLIGIILISANRDLSMGSGIGELLGILLLLASSMTNAFSQVLIRRRTTDPLLLNACQIFTGGTMLLVLSVPIEGLPTGGFPPVFYLALLWLSIVSAAAFSIWYVLLQTPGMKVSEINLFKFIIPVSGALLSWLIIPAEGPELSSIIGMAIIASSVLLFYSRQTGS